MHQIKAYVEQTTEEERMLIACMFAASAFLCVFGE